MGRIVLSKVPFDGVVAAIEGVLWYGICVYRSLSILVKDFVLAVSDDRTGLSTGCLGAALPFAPMVRRFDLWNRTFKLSYFIRT